jgi:hypothetical protein
VPKRKFSRLDFIVRDVARVHNLDAKIIITKLYPVDYDRGESNDAF